MLTGLGIIIGGFLLAVLGFFVSDSLMVIGGFEVVIGAFVVIFNLKGEWWYERYKNSNKKIFLQTRI